TGGPLSDGPASASPFGLPGLGRGRAYAFHGDPTRGATLEAPTAPHATSPVEHPKRLSGPAQFWDGRRIRIALAVTIALSVVVHWSVAPWTLFPRNGGLEGKEVNDPLTTPVELMGEDTPPPPEPAPPAPAPAEPTPNESKDTAAAAAKDAGA